MTAAVDSYSHAAALPASVPLPPVYWLWIAGFLAAYGFLTHFVSSAASPANTALNEENAR